MIKGITGSDIIKVRQPPSLRCEAQQCATRRDFVPMGHGVGGLTPLWGAGTPYGYINPLRPQRPVGCVTRAINPILQQ
jgi:hypothetical protein